MITDVVPLSGTPIPTTGRMAMRFLNDAAFLAEHASGTLRKAAENGFLHHQMLLEERVAFEFGWGFRCVPASRVLVGHPRIESDCAALTECAWHIHRIRTLNAFPSVDHYQSAYLHVTPAEGAPEEGVGIVLTTTHAPFVPAGHLVFAIIARLDPRTHQYLPAENPC